VRIRSAYGVVINLTVQARFTGMTIQANFLARERGVVTDSSLHH
jgi:hypothetical protein